ncbi:MAG: hypothetical protein GYA24_14300 [Candidatus Lokiarchaeota archaeon]|nr:hypothetical protein [Candidatus Lokiarchaeota archaeon]
MKLQFKIALFALAVHVIALIVAFDGILIALDIIFFVLALLTLLPGTSQAMNVSWLFPGLILIASTIFHAYTTIPRTEFNMMTISVSLLQLAGALAAVVANTFGLELKFE